MDQLRWGKNGEGKRLDGMSGGRSHSGNGDNKVQTDGKRFYSVMTRFAVSPCVESMFLSRATEITQSLSSTHVKKKKALKDRWFHVVAFHSLSWFDCWALSQTL